MTPFLTSLRFGHDQPWSSTSDYWAVGPESRDELRSSTGPSPCRSRGADAAPRRVVDLDRLRAPSIRRGAASGKIDQSERVAPPAEVVRLPGCPRRFCRELVGFARKYEDRLAELAGRLLHGAVPPTTPTPPRPGLFQFARESLESLAIHRFGDARDRDGDEVERVVGAEGKLSTCRAGRART